MKCKQYSGITVENWTPVKSVKTTLNIYLQCRICKLQMSFLPTGLPPTQPTELKKKMRNKVSSLKIYLFDLNVMVKSHQKYFVLKFHESL